MALVTTIQNTYIVKYCQLRSEFVSDSFYCLHYLDVQQVRKSQYFESGKSGKNVDGNKKNLTQTHKHKFKMHHAWGPGGAQISWHHLKRINMLNNKTFTCQKSGEMAKISQEKVRNVGK